MRMTKKRGPRGERNKRDGGYFHFLRSPDGDRKVKNPETGNMVKVKSLAGSRDPAARRLLKRERNKFEKKWDTRVKQQKENEKAKEEGRKPKKVEPAKLKRLKPPSPRRPRRPEWRKTPAQRRRKSANRDTALLETLRSMEEGHSKRVVFHHGGGRYRLVFGNEDNQNYYVHVSLLEGKPDPSYLIGKLEGPAAHLIRHLWRMPKVVDIMLYTSERITKAMDDKATPMRERLSRFAREGTLSDVVDRMMKQAARQLSRVEGSLVRFVNARLKEGAEAVEGSEYSTDIELDLVAVLEEAKKAVEALSEQVLRDSSNHRRIKAGLVLLMVKATRAAFLAGKLKFLRQTEAREAKKAETFFTQI